jgi:hypothetical protein
MNKDPHKAKIAATILRLIELRDEAKGMQKRLDELSCHIDTLGTMLDEIGKEFDDQVEFLDRLNSLTK